MRLLVIRGTARLIERADATATAASPDTHALREAMLATVLVAFFVLLGTIGRDPWKADEPYCVGIVQNMLQHGEWLVPHVGTSPFLEKPPLMFWSAAMTAHLFGWALPFVDAARLAVVAWMTATVLAIGWSAKAMYGGRRAWLAVMLTLGAVGFWQHSHKLIPDISQLTGATLALAAVVRFTANSASARKAGLLAGTGIGIAFLSKGLLIPGVYAVLGVLLPVCRRDLRTHAWTAMVSWAAIGALPWFVVWPALLYHASPPMFIEWLWENNLDRFLGVHHHGEEHPSRMVDLVSLMALTLPTSVLAAAALGQRLWRRDFAKAWTAPTVAVVLYALTLMVTLEVSASLREVYFLPLYPAFALLAASFEWPSQLSAGFRRAAVALFAIMALLLFTAWAFLLAGRGEQLPAAVGRWLPLDYALPFQGLALAIALAVSACWLLSVRWRHRLHPVTMWFAGATLAWGLANSLLLPWLDTAKSYRHAFDELARRIPADTRCVTTIGLGESERAMLLYYTGHMPYEMRHTPPPRDCSVAVVMVDGARAMPVVDDVRWIRFWTGSRAGDRNRRFVAYHIATRH